MKNSIILILLVITATPFFSQKKHYCQSKHQNHNLSEKNYVIDTRSDSIDLLHIGIDIDVHAMSGEIKAHTEIVFEARVNNISEIRLDLLDFTIDSVTSNEAVLVFDYDSELLTIDLPTTLAENEMETITVHYHGAPTFDPSGFGGFRFMSGYAFNLGVGFTTDPHTFGRSWIPCFDNFVERTTYSFDVLTDTANFAFCNGEFISRVEVGVDSMRTTWDMESEIPSYLASIGVSTYTFVQSTLSGIDGDIESYLIAKPQDTTDMKNSFINLPSAFATFENRFGPYRWQKVAYNLIPNTSGAMEHATNIAYPLQLTNGTLTYQYVVMHELAHHWWGDLVTCSTQEDMWINEGMASYCEQLFFEDLEGQQSYIDHVRDNHKFVFLEAHENDGAWLPVSGIGWENTYGNTVYNKGSDVAHVMRSYMGDDDFFGILSAFLDENQFTDVSSEDFRDFIIANGTDANMNAYFDNWIFNPGFPEFSIRSQESTFDGTNYTIDLEIEQQLHHAPTLYTDVPLIVRVVDADLNTEDISIIVSGASTLITITSTLEPKAIYMNPNDKISQAAFGDTFEFTETGVENFDYSDFRIDINDIGPTNSLWIRAENHYADADLGDLSDEFKLSEDRFWRVHIINSNPQADDVQDVEGRIKFNGNENSSNYRDETFFIELENIGLTEDSLVLLHREYGDSEWEIYENYEINTSGTANNWVGSIDIPFLKSGDYAWGYRYSSLVNIEETQITIINFAQFDDYIQIDGERKDYNFSVYDSNGKLIEKGDFNGRLKFDTEKLAAGSYLLNVGIKGNPHTENFKFITK